ncbi:MAG: hypothetical protein RPR28_06465 [Cycloclasticus sp.]
MKYDKDIAAHVISNIALIESTRAVIEDVENIIFRKFNAVVKKCVEGSDLALGKDNNFELHHGDNDLYFSTIDWESSAKDQAAWYCFDIGEEGIDEDLYLLTHLLGEHSKNASLRLQFSINKDELGLKLRKFKSNLRGVFLKSKALLALGFQLSECNELIELKVHLDKTIVAEEYPDLDESFEPVIKALNTLFEAHPHFEELVKDMKLLVQTDASQKETAALNESE